MNSITRGNKAEIAVEGLKVRSMLEFRFADTVYQRYGATQEYQTCNTEIARSEKT